MKETLLANGSPIVSYSMELKKIGNNFTGIYLRHCSLSLDTSHIKLLEIMSPTDEEHFIYYQKFKD